MNKILRVGIATVQEQRTRSLAIAAGTRQRGDDEPNVWFSSVTAMARVLSDENMGILKVVREQQRDPMDSYSQGKHI
jgi:predicted transcriptional regulator